MRLRAILFSSVILAVVVAVGLWMAGRRPEPPAGSVAVVKPVEVTPGPLSSGSPAPPNAAVTSDPPGVPPSIQPPMPAPAAVTPVPAAVSPGARSEPAPDYVVTTRAHIESISYMLRDFRTIMGGNPVGSNAEIMREVNGGNPKGARLGPPEGLQLNEKGELVDFWGTPFFFHQNSATHMDIISAGPDRKLGTVDDVKGR